MVELDGWYARGPRLNHNVMHIYHFAFFAYIVVYISMYQVCLGKFGYVPGLSRYMLDRDFVAYIQVHSTTYLVCLNAYF